MRNSRELRTQQLGRMGHGLILMALHLLSLTFLTGFLVVVAIQGSKDPRSHREKIYQELGHLKAGIDRLCRPCPWDWTLFQGNCYFFSKFQKSWADSVTACKEAEAQLVIVESEEEQSFLQETSKKKGFTWMGLSDREEEGTWRWVDDSLLADKFKNYWLPGEPNNVGKEDCAEFRPEGWNDSLCKLNKFWICKKPAASCCYE